MLKQLIFTFGGEEHLVMSQAIELASGLTPTDASLVAPDPIEECLQLQIIRRQTGDIITRQQLFPIAAPQILQAIMPGTLGAVATALWLEAGQELVHFLSDLLPIDWPVWIAAEGITQAGGDPGQPIMGFEQLVCQAAILCQSAFHLSGALLPIPLSGLSLAQGSQSGGYCLQLLVACQSTPLERFATAAIERISDGGAKLSS
jgi:hypothetical protein